MLYGISFTCIIIAVVVVVKMAAIIPIRGHGTVPEPLEYRLRTVHRPQLFDVLETSNLRRRIPNNVVVVVGGTLGGWWCSDPLSRTANVARPECGGGTQLTKGCHTSDGLTGHDHPRVREGHRFVPVVVDTYGNHVWVATLMNVRHQRIHQYSTSTHHRWFQIIDALLVLLHRTTTGRSMIWNIE